MHGLDYIYWLCNCIFFDDFSNQMAIYSIFYLWYYYNQRELNNWIFYFKQLSVSENRGAFFVPIFKKRRRNDMSDFKEIDKAAKALEVAKKKREQYKHQATRYENRLETEEKKQRSKRTHMLCFKAAHLESIFPVVKDASKTDFIRCCNIQKSFICINWHFWMIFLSFAVKAIYTIHVALFSWHN